ncbi:unnamed protein product [Toxocara canis]|uniref:Secreted protein n=1 Tax=Toxocara canis TaxID=6265 RepID=A0A183TWI0_TOXCA|nr:unnamed protein product [Toxocara canis]
MLLGSVRVFDSQLYLLMAFGNNVGVPSQTALFNATTRSSPATASRYSVCAAAQEIRSSSPLMRNKSTYGLLHQADLTDGRVDPLARRHFCCARRVVVSAKRLQRGR